MGVVTLTRDDVVRELTRHCGDGRLTLDELEERIAEAYAATTEEELRQVLRELPVSELRAEPEVAEAPEAPAPARPPAPSRDDTEIHVQHLGHMVKHEKPEWEKAVGTLCAIGGFVLLFNGMFWLALICWFVLPGLIVKHRGR